MLTSPVNVVLACLLSGLAGFLDAIGFIHLGGLFVSFMSGNSTRLGVFLQGGNWRDALGTVGLIFLFVMGAGAGNLIVLSGISRRRSSILFVEALLLAGAALSHSFGLPALPVLLIAFAMGLENAVFFDGRSGGLGLTYVTGALVRVGQLLAVALRGGYRWGWLPSLLQWSALVLGAALGAFAYRAFALDAVWFAAAAALALSAVLVFEAQPQTGGPR